MAGLGDGLEVAAAILARRAVRGVWANFSADEIERLAHLDARRPPALPPMLEATGTSAPRGRARPKEG